MIGPTYVYWRRRLTAARAQHTVDRSRGGSMPVGVIAAISFAIGLLAGAVFV